MSTADQGSVVRAFHGETDEEGRFVLHMGGVCPECGAPPDKKYARNGRVVLSHIQRRCLSECMPRWRAKQQAARRAAHGVTDVE